MTPLRFALNELISLFVDDGNLALFALTLISAVTAIVKLLAVPPLWGGFFLLLGCVAILWESVHRAVGRRT